MHSIPVEISPPKNEADFERMCAQVYGVVFNDRMPKMNGRRGQAQGGVDVFVKEAGVGRLGIQCKKYTLKPVKWTDVEEEVRKADEAKSPIKRLILATTAPNDAALLRRVHALSDEREAAGLFPVEVEFWDDICNHIDRYPVLQDSYAPHAPGAAYHRQESALSSIRELAMETQATVRGLAILPTARPDSADRLISDQLDRTNELLKAGKYRDALEHLAVVGKDLGPFDAHQKARWHLQKGLSLWFSRDDDTDAATLFLKAYELFPDDERMAAAQIRGLMMQGNLAQARAAGDAAIERFPGSQQVWFSLSNVKLLQGERVRFRDVPQHMREEPDALQFIAQAELKAGNLKEAIRLSQQAANSPDAGFFIRATALRIAAECGSRFPVNAVAGALPELETQALQFAVDCFEPHHERLWAIQSESIDDVIVHLGYALLMLRRFPQAVALAREAENLGHRSEEVLRVHTTALFELGNDAEVVALATSRLQEMNAACLCVVSQVAAKAANLVLLEQTVEAAQALNPADPEAVELATALRWEALQRSGQSDLAVKEILAADVATTGGLITACVAVRVLKKVSRTLEADAAVQRAKSLVTAASSESQRVTLAELLYSMGQFAEAGRLFEQLVTPGRLSDLHNRLLACLVRSRSRRRAKELLATFPVEWIENDETRALAMELGRDAADWKFLRPLLDAHVKRYPRHPGNWLFRLGVSLHSSTPAEFQNDLREVPEALDGPVRTTTQLASLELRYGEVERGMRRLYRMVRCNLDEPEALSAYFIAVVGAPGRLPLMEEAMPTVRPGTCVTLRDEYDYVTRVVIDPADVGELPKREGYSAADGPYAVALDGAVVGQEVELPALAFGDKRRYTVTAIESAYRHIIQVVHERALALGGLPNMKVVNLGAKDGVSLDLTQMKAEARRSSDAARRAVDAYAKGHATLSGFAEFIGKSPMDVVWGWPSEGPPLFVGTGLETERIAALEMLAEPGVPYVVDALTVAELVRLDVQEVLAHLPNVLISPVTKAKLEARLRESEEDKSVGTSTEVNGEFAIIEHDAAFHRRRRDFFRAAVEAVEKYCEVTPAYGELGQDGDLARLAEVLQDEELEVLLLARAAGARILTLDGRLRMLLEFVAKVQGVWPQVLVMHCASRELIKPEKFIQSTVQQFLSNRSFVSLSPRELTWMVLQGGGYLQLGMRRFKNYLSAEGTSFISVLPVAFDFLRQIAGLRTSLGAFGEMFEHVLEAAMRHKQCPKEFDVFVGDFIDQLTETLNPAAQHFYEAASQLPLQRVRTHRRYFAARFEAAKQHANKPPRDRPVAVRVLYCSVIPWLVQDKSDGPEDAEVDELEASHVPQAQEGS